MTRERSVARTTVMIEVGNSVGRAWTWNPRPAGDGEEREDPRPAASMVDRKMGAEGRGGRRSLGKRANFPSLSTSATEADQPDSSYQRIRLGILLWPDLGNVG